MHTRTKPATLILLTLSLTAATAFADGAFYGDPPDETHPWSIHDMNRPQPPLVTPGTPSTQEKPGKPPSDAVILFDGTEASLAKWEADKITAEPTKWVVKDGAMQCVPGSGYVRTIQQFGDCQLHVEWAAPAKPEGKSQGRGNSGIFLMGQVEVQVLDNFKNPTYADGFAGSVYGVNPPHANALRAPGEWQIYDIIFRRPIYKDTKIVDPGRLTVTMNGVVVQDSTPLEGGGGHMGRSKDHPFPPKGPLKLQDHGNPVRYRNIWYRPLPPRGIEAGGSAGSMPPEAAVAKKKEIAAGIRTAAAKKEGNEKLLGLMESLCYEPDAATQKEVETMSAAWLENIKKTPAAEMESKKGEVMHLYGPVKYMVHWKFLPETFPVKAEIEKMIKDNGWDKKKEK
ncbi:MAG TPA: DUF1080 domain-containing protein [Verrucomicrobiales bacterium]|nr:DUF1080 domain-containing protein [Verrucomicrobiales bacterium]